MFKKIEKEKLILMVTVFIDVIGIGIVIPVLPFFVEQIGGGPQWVTRLFAVFSVCSFFSMPILGALSDRIGRRPILLVSILSTAIGWIVFASAKSIVFLFVGRIIDGLAAGNFSTAQSYLADISKDEKERTANMGVIGALFGAGFMVGPALGGLLGEYSPTLPFWFVGVLAAINFVLAYIYLPETNFHRAQTKMSFNPFAPVVRGLKSRRLLPTYICWLLFAVAVSIQQSISALYMSDVFNFTTSVIGGFMAAQGLLMVLNQGFAIKKFWLTKFNERNLMLFSALFLSVSFGFMASPFLVFFILGAVLSIFSQPLFRVTVTSESVGMARHDEKGEVLGVLGSVMSLGAIIGPVLAEPAYAANRHYPYILAAIATLVVFVVLLFVRRHLLKHSPPQPDVVVV